MPSNRALVILRDSTTPKITGVLEWLPLTEPRNGSRSVSVSSPKLFEISKNNILSTTPDVLFSESRKRVATIENETTDGGLKQLE